MEEKKDKSFGVGRWVEIELTIGKHLLELSEGKGTWVVPKETAQVLLANSGFGGSPQDAKEEELEEP